MPLLRRCATNVSDCRLQWLASYLIGFSHKNEIQMGEPGQQQQSSLHTFRGFHRRGCAGSGWRGQRRAGKRHVSLSFGLMRYDFENCEFSTTTFQRAKTKSQKIPERAIVAALMPGAPFPRFQWVSPGLFNCSTAFSSAHGNNRLLQCQGEKSGKVNKAAKLF